MKAYPTLKNCVLSASAFALSVLSAHAVAYTTSATATGEADWKAATTWQNGSSYPNLTSDEAYISGGKTVKLSNSSLTIKNVWIGAYTTSATAGNLVLENSQLTFGVLTSGRVTNDTGQTTGNTTIRVTNNSWLHMTNSSNLGYYDTVTNDTPASRQTIEIVVDGTSSISADVIFNIGRGTTATLSLEAGAKAYFFRPAIGLANADSHGYLNMATGSYLSASTLSIGVNGTASILGGQIVTSVLTTLSANSQLFLGSGSSITGASITAAGAASITVLGKGNPTDFETIEFADFTAVAKGVIISLDLAGYTGGDGDMTIIHATSVTNEGNITYTLTNNGEGVNVVFNWVNNVGGGKDLVASITGIPEPASMAAILGLLGLVAAVRRRR